MSKLRWGCRRQEWWQGRFGRVLGVAVSLAALTILPALVVGADAFAPGTVGVAVVGLGISGIGEAVGDLEFALGIGLAAAFFVLEFWARL